MAFDRSTTLRDISLNATTPEDYTNAFFAQIGSVITSQYLGYSELKSYDTKKCAAKCDKIDECMAINIYFERTPTIYLAEECPDAPSMTVIKCVFWGKEIRRNDIFNWGRKDWEFDIVMAGSNGYNKLESTSRREITTYRLLGNASRMVPGVAMLGTLVLAMVAAAFL